MAERGCSPRPSLQASADVDGLQALSLHATDVRARRYETGNAPAAMPAHYTLRRLVIARCLQVLPANIEEVSYAICHRNPEKGKGTNLVGVSLDAPLAVLAQQGQYFIKFILEVAAVHAAGDSQHCATETLMTASRRRAAERFWPAAFDVNGASLYNPEGPKKVRCRAVCSYNYAGLFTMSCICGLPMCGLFKVFVRIGNS